MTHSVYHIKAHLARLILSQFSEIVPIKTAYCDMQFADVACALKTQPAIDGVGFIKIFVQSAAFDEPF